MKMKMAAAVCLPLGLGGGYPDGSVSWNEVGAMTLSVAPRCGEPPRSTKTAGPIARRR
jgi:hypothetical protein